MRRGDIYYAALDPTVGSEIQKTRPVLIISNNANNRAFELVTVLPFTSNTKKIFPFEVYLSTHETGLPKNAKLQCQQIRTIFKNQIKSPRISYISEACLMQVNNAIKLHLDI